MADQRLPITEAMIAQTSPGIARLQGLIDQVTHQVRRRPKDFGLTLVPCKGYGQVASLVVYFRDEPYLNKLHIVLLPDLGVLATKEAFRGMFAADHEFIPRTASEVHYKLFALSKESDPDGPIYDRLRELLARKVNA